MQPTRDNVVIPCRKSLARATDEAALDDMATSENIAIREGSAVKERVSPKLIVAALFLVIFLLYVLSAPFGRDAQGFPLRAYSPVWSAAAAGPLCPVLKPYFKICGIEFQVNRPDPPRESYE
jgi:hypothetical protein